MRVEHRMYAAQANTPECSLRVVRAPFSLLFMLVPWFLSSRSFMAPNRSMRRICEFWNAI